MLQNTKHYENKKLGIAFDYPPDWIEVTDEKLRNGIDIMMYDNFSRFGILRSSSELSPEAPVEIVLPNLLKGTINENEILVEDSKLDKYPIRNGQSVTMSVRINFYETNETVIQEKTFVVNSTRNLSFFVIIEWNLNNTSSKRVADHMNLIYNSFRFL